MYKLGCVFFGFFSLFLVIGCKSDVETDIMSVGEDFPVYGGNSLANRYSPLSQINVENVDRLELAWTYDARDIDEETGERVVSRNQIQCQPIVIDGILYGTTPDLRLFALDADSGTEVWRFDPTQDEKRYGIINVSRGVTYWNKGDDRRILYSSGDLLYCIDANTGNLIEDFGNGGTVDLHIGLDNGIDKDISTLSVVATSPGIIYQDYYIIGSGVAENGLAAPGHVRAIDVLTGELVWVFHTIPHPDEVGYDTWPEDAYQRIGAANSWGGLSVDHKRGIVVFGTGSPASDFYGGDRPGENLFGNCIIALDAKDGKLLWYFQTIRHDLWDRDIPCQPNLATINFEGKKRDVVVQATKDGNIFILDRDSGESLFPLVEREVPTKGLPGEEVWPTQIYPTKPAPLMRQIFTEEDITDISEESYEFVRKQYLEFKTDHEFTPPSEEGTLLFGYSGGAEWGGNSIDQDGILYQCSNQDPWILKMVDTGAIDKDFANLSYPEILYRRACGVCHGNDRKGDGDQFPGLMGVRGKYSGEEIVSIITNGRGRMPGFNYLKKEEIKTIANFIMDIEENPETSIDNPRVKNETTPVKEKFGFKPRYVAQTWKKLVDQDGYPGIKPPWGTLNAIDLESGDYLWTIPIGEYPSLVEKGIRNTGTDIYGGTLATGGGLIFLGGTWDEKLRAIDKRDGKIVWEYTLPAGGFASPITYSVDGVQYVAIAAGGNRGQKPGGYYIAFKLSED